MHAPTGPLSNAWQLATVFSQEDNDAIMEEAWKKFAAEAKGTAEWLYFVANECPAGYRNANEDECMDAVASAAAADPDVYHNSAILLTVTNSYMPRGCVHSQTTWFAAFNSAETTTCADDCDQYPLVCTFQDTVAYLRVGARLAFGDSSEGPDAGSWYWEKDGSQFNDPRFNFWDNYPTSCNFAWSKMATLNCLGR